MVAFTPMLMSRGFCRQLPEWFIKLFTQTDDTVLDPFMGIGTTIFVAHEMGRKAIGIEIMPEYYEKVLAESAMLQKRLFYS